MKAFFAQEIGSRISLRIYWGDRECSGSYHNAMRKLIDIKGLINFNPFGSNPEDYPEKMWPVKCDKCGIPVPADAKRQVFHDIIYNTPSGLLEPGCIYWIDWFPDNLYWNNHTGPHLAAVLPNGWHWVIDSRASNCTLPDDRTHRCWCRHGEPPNITVDKNGNTCSAGAGSIDGDQWHGFLQSGEFRKC